MLDLRTPIGWMFLVVGLLLVAFGLASGPAIYRLSLGYNLNLDWGAVMALFGAGMLGLAYRDRNGAL